jgi:hypothetical protein
MGFHYFGYLSCNLELIVLFEALELGSNGILEPNHMKVKCSEMMVFFR